MPSLDVPVLIVGAGPAGLACALLLEQQRIDTLLVERRDGHQPAPAAHVVNARTFEILRSAGVDMDAIARASIAPEDAGVVAWVTRLGGERIGTLPYEQQGDDQLDVTPTPLRNLSQNRLEPILRDGLTGDVRFGWQWESGEQDADGVTSQCVERATGERLTVRSRYVVAADGAGSRIRKSLGIEPQGPEKLQTFVMIHLETSLRSRLGSPPAVLSFVCDPGATGVFVAHDPDREAVFMIAYDDTAESLADYDEARCTALVRSALADPDLDFHIANVLTWQMTAQVAERYRDGRIFLVGDAAHRFPPTGGLGLNSGVQDAHNLAWKLAWVLEGRTDEALLDSYESERRPVAQSNANQSLKNALRLFEVPAALGLADPEAATREAMEQVLASPAGRAAVETAIANQAEHFDMPGQQLGFSYAPDAEPPDPRHFVPSGAPGHRVPHAWLSSPGRVSVLDRIAPDGFTLLTGPEADAWPGALSALGDDAPVVLQVLGDAELPALGRWLDEAGIARSGALLVRPDQHVAWRAPDASGASGLPEALARALRGASYEPPARDGLG